MDRTAGSCVESGTVEKTEKNDVLEMTKIIRENKDIGERLFFRFQRAGCKACLILKWRSFGQSLWKFYRMAGRVKSQWRSGKRNQTCSERRCFLVSLPEVFLKDMRIDTDYQEGWKQILDGEKKRFSFVFY